MNSNNSRKYAIALGYFDGLHLAHMSVINKAVGYASDGLIPAVLLFDKHPSEVITGKKVPQLLQNEKRDELLKSKGVEPLYICFNNIKDMSPEEFVRDILIKKLHAGALICGYNYSFGKNSSGDAAVLGKLAEKYNLELTVCPPFSLNEEEVSSTKIRNAVAEGDIEKANRMLGYPFMFSSEIFTGDRRGRLLGAPTINQYLPEGLTVPRFGVYASEVFFDGRKYTGVTNIGSRPTFDGGSFRSETYIIGYSGDLYGRTVEVHLHSFIRPEKKFPDADTLKMQIAEDVKAAEKTFLKKNKKI